jgi:hypothetical protein
MMCCCRTALTGFRSGWQHLKAPSTFPVNSDTESPQVDRFDYAADASEDDKKEATQASMSIKKPTKDEQAKVSSTNFYSINTSIVTAGIVANVFFFSVSNQN